MRSEIGRDDFQLIWSGHGLEYADLSFQVQPVTAFGLDCSRSILEEFSCVLNVKIRCNTHCLNTRQDSSATRQNVHVRSPLNAPFKFISAAASINSMCMGVDESGQYNSA